MTAAEMNGMILANIGTQLQEQITDSIKDRLATIYKKWLRDIIKTEAPVLSGQVTKTAPAAGEEQPANEEEAS